jgi:thiol-disulfide isomerase/thioredoxin
VGDRLAILGIVSAVALFLYGLLLLYRRRWTEAPERLAVDRLGLELMEGCCAFVLFSSPSCRPCKAALSVVQSVVEKARGVTEIVQIDATEQPDLAHEYGVRTIPTVFLITASGHVVHRWRSVPDHAEAEAALISI